MPNFISVDFDPFEGTREIEKITVTNESQREIWLSCIFGGNDANLSYNESVSLAITGNLNFEAFKQAVTNLILRHEALRSTVSADGETLVIYRDFPVDLELSDISGLTGSEKKNALHTFLRHEIDRPLNLQDGPLFKVFLHKLNEGEYYFTIIKHHIIGDGWSTGIMLEDLSKMYNAYSKGENILLDKPYQISDYATAQGNFKSVEAYKQTEDYWLNLYKDSVPRLDMPTDRPRVSPRSYKGNRVDRPLSPEMVDELKAIGAKAGCSLVTTLLAAFEVFLYQKTKQQDIVVGLPSSGQSASGLIDVVGNCVNLLPLKSHIDPEASFSDYLKKRKKEVLDAYDHQRLTFGELIKKLKIPRDTSRIPLVPVVFNIDMGMDNAVAFDGLDFKLISNPRAYENFELFLNATRSKDGIVLEWSYNTGLFNIETINTFNSDYYSILEKIITDPGTSLSDLAKEDENKTNLTPAKEVPNPSQTINTLIENIVKNYPNKIAVSFNNTSLTYQQLNEKANQLSAFLIHEKSIGAGDIVGLLLDRSIEMMVSLLAVLKAGAVYLPLDPEYPHERIKFMLEDSSAKILLTSNQFKNRYKTNAVEVVIDEICNELSNYQPQTHEKEINVKDLVYILYTSGSTGKPKGVKITHANLFNFLVSMQKAPGIKDTDRLLAVTTISFDIAGLELYLPLITGAELVIADADAVKDGRLLLGIIEEKGITMMQATPSTWQMMLDSGWQKRYPLKVLSGGEALPKELATQLLPLADELWNMYGPTETTIWSTIKQILPGTEIISIGVPIDNTQVYIIDGFGKQVPANTPGEIYIGGDGVAEGYLNRPELTSDKFVPDTFSENPGAKLYRTGDLGKILDNGEIQCLGRLDQQVKIRGHRIELGEIENVLSAQNGIKQSVVIAQEDERLNKYLVAYAIPGNFDHEPDGKISKQFIQEWRQQLGESLPYYMVPDEFISLENFPLTPNGKIDRKAFPKPNRNKVSEDITKHLPTNSNEQLVADIWSQILGIENIDITDDFFDLGGHSLLAVRTMVAIEKKTGKRLPLATLFNNSTIQTLAKQLSIDEQAETWDSIVHIKATGTKPPLFLIHGSGLNLLMFKSLIEHFGEDQPVYGIQALGLSTNVEIPNTVEGISAIYVNEILRVNPRGPYCLAGYSYGGFIALEIAKQLKADGKEVTFLGMIDTNAGAITHATSKTVNIAQKIQRQFRKVPFFVNSFIKYPLESLQYQQFTLKRKFARLFLSTKPTTDKDTYSLYEMEIYDTYNTAINNYKLTLFDMEVLLFRVEKRLYFIDDQKYLGWDKFALKGVKIHETPGDHKTFLDSPNDEKFAGIVQRALDRSNNV
jgi:amino acid adenylation domain-containing protein